MRRIAEPELPAPSPAAANGHAGDRVTPAAPAASLPGPANSDGRDARGRFTAGNRVACGNPFARRVAALRSALLEVATPERVRELAERLFQLARGGDMAAAKLLLCYTVGRPTPAVDPDALDLQELRLLAEGPDVEQLVSLIKRVATGFAAEYVRGKQPTDPEGLGRFVEDALRSMRRGLDGLDDIDLDDAD